MASVGDFYRARAGRPLFLAPGNEHAAQSLLHLLETAEADGFDPKVYRIKELQRAIRDAWGGNARAVQRAELMLADAFVS